MYILCLICILSLHYFYQKHRLHKGAHPNNLLSGDLFSLTLAVGAIILKKNSAHIRPSVVTFLLEV